MECLNGEDEKDCKKVTKPNSYNSKEPPAKKEADWLTEVNVLVEIAAISHIKEINLNFLTRFHLHLVWKDHRLTFLNLKDDLMQNIIDEEEARNLWIPPLVIESAEDANEKNLKYDEHTIIAVKKASDPDSFRAEIINESRLFQGAFNPLVLIRNYEVVLRCNFQLSYYPFDHQLCYINARIFII